MLGQKGSWGGGGGLSGNESVEEEGGVFWNGSVGEEGGGAGIWEWECRGTKGALGGGVI